jgi:hypothetical protein
MRFQKGQSGNPAGKPKGLSHKARLAKEVAALIAELNREHHPRADRLYRK